MTVVSIYLYIYICIWTLWVNLNLEPHALNMLDPKVPNLQRAV